MSDLTRKLHNLKSAGYKPEWQTNQRGVKVKANIHGRELAWRFKITGERVNEY